MYEELNRFLENTDLKDQFEMIFIDLLEDDLNGYENERKILDKGYQLPITFIGGKAAFSGKVDHKKTYQILKRMIK